MQRARECLDEIVRLYQDGPQEKAPELLQRITDLYLLTLEQQSPSEMGTFGDVMIRMSQSADPLARARFAERISKASPVPVELLHLLARDEICIARPVLQYSESLRERDLVSILSEVNQEHMSATALRLNLTEPVTDILVERGDNDVLVALARNTGASLSPSGKSRLFAEAGNRGPLLDALNARRDTAQTPIHMLMRLGESEFWHRVAETLLMSEEKVEDNGAELETPAPPPVTQPEVSEKPKPTTLSPADRAAKRGNVAANEKLLVEAARGGKIVETIDVMARISSLEHAMVEHCLFQAHLPALMVLCKAHKLSASTFTAILQLRESYTETPITNTIDLLRRYEAMTPDTAKRVIRFADKARPESPESPEK